MAITGTEIDMMGPLFILVMLMDAVFHFFLEMPVVVWIPLLVFLVAFSLR
jgi:hypothetical protein